MAREQEKAELYKTIWKIADELRGSMDGWDFKSYVLCMLFYRFISENLTNYLNQLEREAGNNDFDYAKLSDEDAEAGREDTVKEKGFYILPSELFDNVRKQSRSDLDSLNEQLSRIFGDIENSAKGTASESKLKGLFKDMDVNNNKLADTVKKRNEQLLNVMDAVGGMQLGDVYGQNAIDTFGMPMNSSCPCMPAMRENQEENTSRPRRF